MSVLPRMVMASIAGLGWYTAAGGWAVITVVNPPDVLQAGATYRIEYVVRQHGVTLLQGLRGSLTVQPGGSAAESSPVTVTSEPGSSTGHYIATIRVPDTDRLSLAIRSGFSGGGWGDLTLTSIPVVPRGKPLPPVAESDRGHRLFVAKGCGTCHVNGDVPEFAAMNRVVGVGPELTGRRLEAEYVRQRLTNPSSLPKLGDSPVRMPNLGLSEGEVNALVALISGSTERATR
jgi:hypothetical protein